MNKKMEETVQELYKKVPEVKELSFACRSSVEAGICNGSCCTVSHMTPIEKEFINENIKEKKLNLPLVTGKIGDSYYTPNTENLNLVLEDDSKTRCLYFGKSKECLIYDFRPLMCRVAGLLPIPICYTADKFRGMMTMTNMALLFNDLRIASNIFFPEEKTTVGESEKIKERLKSEDVFYKNAKIIYEQ
jgi:Fe-S-cluster containining protein